MKINIWHDGQTSATYIIRRRVETCVNIGTIQILKKFSHSLSIASIELVALLI